MESISKNKLIFLGIGVCALGIGAIYYLWQASKKRRPPKKWLFHVQALKNGKTVEFVDYSEDQNYTSACSRLREVISNEKQVGFLSKSSVLTINRLALLLVKQPFLFEYKRRRELRREVLGSISEYAHEYLKGEQSIRQLIDYGLEQVLWDLSLDSSTYEAEFKKLSAEGADFLALLSLLYENAKSELSQSKGIFPSSAQIEDLFAYQLEIFDQFNFSDLEELSTETKALLKQAYIGELASVKFGIEEEDLLRASSALNDPRVVQVKKALQDKLNQELQKMTSFPY